MCKEYLPDSFGAKPITLSIIVEPQYSTDYGIGPKSAATGTGATMKFLSIIAGLTMLLSGCIWDGPKDTVTLELVSRKGASVWRNRRAAGSWQRQGGKGICS